MFALPSTRHSRGSPYRKKFSNVIFLVRPIAPSAASSTPLRPRPYPPSHGRVDF